MVKLLLNSCCGCWSLKIGVIFIAVFEMMVSSLSPFVQPQIGDTEQGEIAYIIMVTVAILSAISAVVLLFGPIYYQKWILLPWLIGKVFQCTVILAMMILVPVYFEKGLLSMNIDVATSLVHLIPIFQLLSNMYPLTAHVNSKFPFKFKKTMKELFTITIAITEMHFALLLIVNVYFFLIVLSFFFVLKNEDESKMKIESEKNRA